MPHYDFSEPPILAPTIPQPFERFQERESSRLADRLNWIPMSAERLGLDLEIVVRSRCMQKGTAFAIIRSADTTESESRTRFCPLPPAGTRAAPGEKRAPIISVSLLDRSDRLDYPLRSNRVDWIFDHRGERGWSGLEPRSLLLFRPDFNSRRNELACEASEIFTNWAREWNRSSQLFHMEESYSLSGETVLSIIAFYARLHCCIVCSGRMELIIECFACGRNTPYDMMELEGYIYMCVLKVGKSVGSKWNFMGNILSLLWRYLYDIYK